MQEASSIRVNNEVYRRKKLGEQITVLSLGESFFDLPVFEFLCSDSSNHYIDTLGREELRDLILSNDVFASCGKGLKLTSENVMITAGAKIGVLQALQCLSYGKSAFRVGYVEPGWVSYASQIELVGGEAVPVSMEQLLAGKLTANLDCLILNNPHNPTGMVFDEVCVKRIAEFARVNSISLIGDEVYSNFCGKDFYSLVNLIDGEREVVVVNSLSKNFGLSGWRIGYTIASNRSMDRLKAVQQHSMTCASVPIQDLIIQHYQDIIDATRSQIELVMKKRTKVVSELILNGFRPMAGTGTFYIFVECPNGQNVDEKLEELLLNGVAIVPGSGYGGDFTSFFRLSYGTEPLDAIIRAISKLREVLLA